MEGKLREALFHVSCLHCIGRLPHTQHCLPSTQGANELLEFLKLGGSIGPLEYNVGYWAVVEDLKLSKIYYIPIFSKMS